MAFTDKYTTDAKIKDDTTGKEAKKTILTNDAFALSEMIDILVGKIESLRGLLR